MNRRIVPVPGFDLSVAALGERAEVRAVVRALIDYVARHPNEAPRIAGLEVRVIKSRSYGPYPPLRLVYRAEGVTVYLYEIGLYDELHD